MNKLTLIVLFFIVFINCHNQANAQYRQLRLANEELEKNNFDKSKVFEKIKKYEKELGLTPESKYIRSKYLLKNTDDLTSIDSAYVYFSEAFNGLGYYDQKIKDELCKEIFFCETNRDAETDEIDLLIFNKYVSFNSLEIIESYINKYSVIGFRNKSIIIRDSLEFDKIKLLNDELLLKNLLIKRPNSVFFDEVQELMYKVAFNKIKSSNSLEKYEEYIKKYPNSSMLNEAIEFVSTKYWEIIDPQNNKELYRKFILQYPKSKFTEIANRKIEDIDWKNSQDSDLLAGYEDFVLKYPNSNKLNIAKQKIKEFKELVLPYLKVNKKYNLYNIGTLQFVGDNEYDSMLAINNGFFIVSKYKKYGVIDLLGTKIIPCTYDCIQPSGNFFVVKLGKNTGIINNKGNRVVDFAFESISITSSGRFIISKNINNLSSSYGLISTTGEELLDPIYSEVREIDQSTYLVSSNDQSYFINEKGVAKSLKFSSISPLRYDSNLFFEVELKGKKGLVNSKGEILIPIIYESIEDAGDYLIVSSNIPKSGKLYGILDKSGKILITPKYKNITFCGKDLFGINTDLPGKSTSENYRLYSLNSTKFLTQESYDSLVLLENGLIKVEKNELVGFINQGGEMIVSLNFQQYFGDSEGRGGDESYDEESCYIYFNSDENIANLDFIEDTDLILVQLSDKIGYINKLGEIVIPIIYSYGSQFYKGLTTVYNLKGDTSIPSIIDSKGNIIMDNAEILYYYNNSKFILAKQNNNFFNIDTETLNFEPYTLLKGIENIEHYKKYKIFKYKGLDVYVTSKNKILMDDGIDFSDYDFNLKVNDARNLYYSENYDTAISKLLSLNNEKENDYEINLLLGQCYKSKNDAYQALEYFNSAIDIDPNNTVAYSERLDINYGRKNWSDARNDLYKLINFSSEYDEYLTFKLAYCCSQLNLNNEAFENYTKILKNNPKNCSAYNNRGNIYSNRGDYQLALNDYVNALKYSKYESNESKGLYLNNAANQCVKLNKKAEACAYWTKGAALDNASCINNKKYYCK